jgi:hypothetical protein
MVRKEISSFFKNYKMKVLDEWTIINYLHLANPLVPAKNVCFLSFSLSYYFNQVFTSLPIFLLKS